MEEFEYSAVRVDDHRRGLDGAPQELSSVLTRQGWSLLRVVTHPGVYGGGTWAYFRRTVARPAEQQAAEQQAAEQQAAEEHAAA